ncbi:MAG: hypothetical protein LC799_00365 [Actinobacteria bacterium]|nr:hypothetical protein [Actinomycetota bacterium]
MTRWPPQTQWAADAPVWVLRALGAKPDPLTGTVSTPSEATLRRALAQVDARDLQRRSTEWVAALRASTGDEGAGLAAVAIDGKSVRGAAENSLAFYKSNQFSSVYSNLYRLSSWPPNSVKVTYKERPCHS